MQNRLKFMISAAALFAVAAFLIGCGAPAANNTATNSSNATNSSANNSTAIPADNSKADNTADNSADNKDAKSDEAAKDESASADKIGVAECDDYWAKVNACVNSKVPEAARASFKSAMDQSMKAWKQAASTPEGKAGLATACKQALETAKTSFSAYKCEW
jgi:hypothetical protein